MPPAWRWASGAVAISATLLAAAAGLAGFALAWQENAPERALQLVPGLARAELASAAHDDDPLAREAAARRALSRRPLDGVPLRLLAEEAARRGEIARARDLFARAARRAPRDRVAHAWLADDAISRRAPDVAVGHLDALMRMDALLPAALAPTLATLAADPEFATVLARRMRRAPWRESVLVAWATRASDVDMAALLPRVGEDSASLPLAVRDAWAASLIRAGRWGAAYSAWDPAPRAAGLADPGFEGDRVDGFGWTLSQADGVSVARVASEGTRGRVLRVEAAGNRVASRPAAQRLVLRPGAYRFEAKARADAPGGSGWRWAVVCAGMTEPRLGASAQVAGNGAWASVSMDFVVPHGCGGQWLALEADPGADAGRHPRGVAWFDDLRVRPIAEQMLAGSDLRILVDPDTRVDVAPVPPSMPDPRNLVTRVRAAAMQDVPVGP